jgi:hypothetical protein
MRARPDRVEKNRHRPTKTYGGILGAPARLEAPVEGENPNQTVEVYEYDGATLEFDQTSPQKVALGGVILDRPKK